MGAPFIPVPPGQVVPDPWKIRLRREAAGLTQPQVGAALNAEWPAMTISRLEGYAISVSPDVLGALAELFGCDQVDLCSGAATWHKNYELWQARRPFRNVSAAQFAKDAESDRRRKKRAPHAN